MFLDKENTFFYTYGYKPESRYNMIICDTMHVSEGRERERERQGERWGEERERERQRDNAKREVVLCGRERLVS